MNPQSIYQINRDPLFRQMKSRLEDQIDAEVVSVRKRLAEMSFRAIDKMDSLLDSMDERIVLSASKDVLDRAGYKPVEKSESHEYHHLSIDEIKDLKNRAKSAGAMIEDAEFKEIEKSEESEDNSEILSSSATEGGLSLESDPKSNFSSSLFAPPTSYLEASI